MWSANIYKKLEKERLQKRKIRDRGLFVPQARDQRHADRLHLTRALKHLSLVAGDSAVCTSCFRYFSNRCSFEIVENFEHRRMGFQGCSVYRGPKGSHPFHSLQSRSFREWLGDWSRSTGNANTIEKCVPSREDGKVCVASRKAGEYGSANANETLNEGTKTKIWRKCGATSRLDESTKF